LQAQKRDTSPNEGCRCANLCHIEGSADVDGSYGAASDAPLRVAQSRPLAKSAKIPIVTARRIMIVEDSASTRSFVRSALETSPRDEPLEIVEAASGFDALRLLPRAEYDLVITDINMPDINGLEIVQFIRKSDRHKATPVILISTQTSEKDRDRGLSLGANDFLAKPLDAISLVAAVDRLLGARTAGG
jgi:two-component system chemotaxis response regulator CheY